MHMNIITLRVPTYSHVNICEISLFAALKTFPDSTGIAQQIITNVQIVIDERQNISGFILTLNYG